MGSLLAFSPRRLPPAHPPAAVFLRERLHVIQWLGIGMLLAGGALVHGDRICCIQPIGTNPHASTPPLEQPSRAVLPSQHPQTFYLNQTYTPPPPRPLP